jgi:hypothetical protein
MRSRGDRARWMGGVRAGVGLAAATVLLSFSAAHAASPRHVAAAPAVSGSVPTLGVASIAPSGAGFGQVKPRTVSLRLADQLFDRSTVRDELRCGALPRPERAVHRAGLVVLLGTLHGPGRAAELHVRPR